jgi:hypothetical protein
VLVEEVMLVAFLCCINRRVRNDFGHSDCNWFFENFGGSWHLECQGWRLAISNWPFLNKVHPFFFNSSFLLNSLSFSLFNHSNRTGPVTPAGLRVAEPPPWPDYPRGPWGGSKTDLYFFFLFFIFNFLINF